MKHAHTVLENYPDPGASYYKVKVFDIDGHYLFRRKVKSGSPMYCIHPAHLSLLFYKAGLEPEDIRASHWSIYRAGMPQGGIPNVRER